jgi:ABC-type multidrug transport system ATPase subunit
LRKKKLIKEDTPGNIAFSMPDKSEGNHQVESNIAIKAEGLTKKFGKFCAVDNIDFHVRQGEIFGLLGANGAGKTTVMKMLTGIMLPTAGSGRVAGADMRTAGRGLKKRIGYMSQMFSLYRDLTVVENIRLYAGVYGLNRRETREQTQWVISMAGLAGYETKLAGSLPMGLTQRLALGCALVHGPRVVFLDEPTSGVDPVGRRRFWDILFNLSREAGITIMLTTHYVSESEHCDHLALMYAGRIVADASPAKMKMQLQAEFGNLLEVSTNKPLIAFKLLKNQGFGGVSLFGNEIHLMAKDPGQADSTIRTLLTRNRITLTSICEKPLTMEDVFVNRVTALEKQESNLKLVPQN